MEPPAKETFLPGEIKIAAAVERDYDGGDELYDAHMTLEATCAACGLRCDALTLPYAHPTTPEDRVNQLLQAAVDAMGDAERDALVQAEADRRRAADEQMARWKREHEEREAQRRAANAKRRARKTLSLRWEKTRNDMWTCGDVGHILRLAAGGFGLYPGRALVAGGVADILPQTTYSELRAAQDAFADALLEIKQTRPDVRWSSDPAAIEGEKD